MSEINMTPLVDVMLVLVVIFIITAPLMSQLDPARSAQDRCRHGPERHPSFVTLAIDKAGQTYLERPSR